MKRIIGLVFFILFVCHCSQIQAQPSIVVDSGVLNLDTFDNLFSENTGYSYTSYLEDSAANHYIYDSIKNKWIVFDTTLPVVKKFVKFALYKNIEFKKNMPRPLILTFFMLLLVVLFMLKRTFFDAAYHQEFLAAFRPFYFKNWLDEMLALINLFNVYSKLLSTILIGVLFSVMLLRFGWFFNPNFALQTLIIILGCVLLGFIKYVASLFLGYLFDKMELSKIHFTIHQVNQSFIWVPVFIALMLNYFLYGSYPTQWFLLVALVLVVLERVVSIVQLAHWGLFKIGEKKLYLLMYICTFEILPILVISRYVALAYV